MFIYSIIDVPTAWSCSGPVRRTGAGKVEFLRQGYPRLSAVAFQIRVRLMNKNQNGSAWVPMATNIEPKGCQQRPTLNQKGANTSKNCSKIKPWSVRICISLRWLFCQNGNNGHGILTGLTNVKGTIVCEFIFCIIKYEQVVSGTCTSYQSKR